MKIRLLLVFSLLVTTVAQADLLPSDMTPVGANVPGVTDYEVPIFSDAARCNYYGWTVDGNVNGDLNTPHPPLSRSQLSGNGYPLVVPAGTAAVYSRVFNGTLHKESGLIKGLFTLTWKGNADVRLTNIPSGTQQSGSGSGSLVDGTRTYLVTGDLGAGIVGVYQIDPKNPLTSIKVMMPDPADPTHKSIDPSVIFHPSLMQHLREANWAYIRTMDLTHANGNPQKEWSDRQTPDYLSQVDQGNGTAAEPILQTGSAWEFAVAMANEADKNLWICVPYMASDDYITKLSQLICFGSDGVNPYPGPVGKPVWAPLHSNLKLYIEYSNEMWNLAFGQNTWASTKAMDEFKDPSEVGVGKIVGQRDCQIWSIFEKTFGSSSRLVRVAGGSLAFPDYSKSVLNEISAEGPKQVPPTKADATETAPYFQYSIPEWAAAQSWFPDYVKSNTLPAPALKATLAEWDRAMLSDAYNTQETWPLVAGGVPLICYEGGPDPTFPIWQFPDQKVSYAASQLGFLIQRDSGIRELYENWLNMSRAEGMRIFGMYTLSAGGAFSHLEYLDEPLASAPKYQVVLDWLKEAANLRFVDDPAGKPPSFVTPKALPPAQIGQPYSQTIATQGGNGPRQTAVVDFFTTVPGLTATPVGDTIQISGTPSGSGADGGTDYLHARVVDQAGNPAWRVFGLPLYGGAGTLVNCDLAGNPTAVPPWTKTRILASGLTFSGWTIGPGAVVQDEPNGLGIHTLKGYGTVVTEATAESANDGLVSTLTSPTPMDLRNGTLHFSVQRVNYGSALQVAIYASINGGAIESTPIFDLKVPLEHGDNMNKFFSATIPNTTIYQSVKSIEFHLFFYGDAWSGPTALTEFQVASAPALP